MTAPEETPGANANNAGDGHPNANQQRFQQQQQQQQQRTVGASFSASTATTTASSASSSSFADMKRPSIKIQREGTVDLLGGEPPKSFYCPLTMSVMRDPVVDREGNSYERAAILEWLTDQGHTTSPVTRNALTKAHLAPNRALREAIADRMGPGFVVEQDSQNTTAPEPELTPRAAVAGFLEHISAAVGKDIKLNDQGICAFTYEQLTIVIEVPERVGSFFIYTELLSNLAECVGVAAVSEKALRLNYLQQETRGGCLSLDPISNGLMFSYTDRIKEINATDFRNILENFIDTALNLYKALEAMPEAKKKSSTEGNDDTASEKKEEGAEEGTSGNNNNNNDVEMEGTEAETPAATTSGGE